MSAFLSVKDIFLLMGVVVMFLVVLTLRDKGNPKRYTSALFWFLFGLCFLLGDWSVAHLGKPLTYRLAGVFVIIMALLAGTGQLAMGTYAQSSPQEREQSAQRLGNKIFWPALLIPLVTVLCTIGLKGVKIGEVAILDQSNLTIASLTVACIAAVLLAWKITGGTPLQAVRESRRLVDSIGWAAVLPQMLAMLGGVFVVAKTGQSVQQIITMLVDPDNRFLLVAMYGVGMALLTMIMGNAFAAFPIMSAGVALPFLINMHHANPAPLVAIGMYCGYCGTLMTPMAANFNIVPAALLDLKDKYQVIKVQIPTAIPLLITNIFLMYFFVFR